MDETSYQQRLEQCLIECYDACKAILVMIDFYESPQFEAEWARIDSPRLHMIRRALIDAEELIKEMSDE